MKNKHLLFLILLSFSFSNTTLTTNQTKAVQNIGIEQKKFFSYPIIVNNKSNKTVYIATYYQKNLGGFKCKKCSQIKKIAPNSYVSIDKPFGKIPYGRKLIFTRTKNKLKETLTKNKYNLITRRGIGDTTGLQFFIKLKNNVLRGYTDIEWKITKPFWGFFSSIKNAIFDKIIKKAVKHEYVNKTAKVRFSKKVPPEEKNFVSKRKKYTKRSLEKLLGITLEKNQIPNIAFCLSGGGYRAMIGSLGALLGAKKIGLLDCVTHVSCLSGSTWLMAPWTTLGISLEKYKEQLKKKVNKSLIVSSINFQETAKILTKKILFKQKISLVDLYGALLTNKLLPDLEKENLHLSKTTPNFEKGKFPLPIYTAVETTTNYYWFEFTPYEIGCIPFNSYIKPWAFGRKFANGKSKDYPPEQNLGFLMGIFGSAFAANFKEIVDAMQDKPKTKDLYNLIYFVTSQPDWKKIRLSSAKIRNFTYGIQDCDLQNKKNITLVDAGININLPFPPLLRSSRKIDIIIACDLSTNSKTGNELIKAEKYAKKHGLKFPKIDSSKINKNVVSIFRDKNDSTIPTVIYFPMIKNEKYSTEFDPEKALKGYCSTLNFSYNNEQFEELSGLMEFNVIQSKNKIIKAIARVIANG